MKNKKHDIEMEEIILELVTRHQPMDDKVCGSAANWIDILFKHPEYALDLDRMIEKKKKFPMPIPTYTFDKKGGGKAQG